ncbi:hypothetical protein YTPLAS18_31730 [Nitrospira sp.]|nr:hypothetical protein YTPLAS18_31730 [Nitrospira sp.]
MNHMSAPAIGLALWMFAMGAAVDTHAASAMATLTQVTIQSMNQDKPQITIRTVKGDRFTLVVASPKLLEGVHEGDTCTLELDADDRVITLVKTGLEQ